MESARSTGPTLTYDVARLSAGAGSAGRTAETSAHPNAWPAICGGVPKPAVAPGGGYRTSASNAKDAPEASVGRRQVETLPDAVHTGDPGADERTVRPSGISNRRRTLSAAAGPWLTAATW
jgi:hypothetical protein